MTPGNHRGGRPRKSDPLVLGVVVVGVVLLVITGVVAAMLVRSQLSRRRAAHLAALDASADDGGGGRREDGSALATSATSSDGGGGSDAADTGDAGAAERRRFNVVLITIDTLRADQGFAGYARPVSPNLDAFAARSTVFERMYATAPYTMKSLGALHTGRYAGEAFRDLQHYTKYGAANVFLAERVKAGAATSTSVRTVAVMCHRYFAMRPGFEQGFDVYDVSAMPEGMTDSDLRSTSHTLTDVALRLLKRPENAPSSDRQLFAWIHYFDPHSPYVGHDGAPAFGTMPSTSLNRARDVYDAEVWFTDVHVGRLLDQLAATEWAKDTAIIITADHGEAFGEKGHYRHGRELWEPLVRVPFILYIPGVTPKRIPIKRSHIDLVPTILELMGIPTNDADPKLRGKSLLTDVFASPSAKDSPLEERDIFFDVPEGERNEQRNAILFGPTPGVKFLRRSGKTVELYDLAADPEEANDLSSSDATRLAEARARYEKLTSGLEEKPPLR
jgi:choline-sulfatase